MRLSLLSACIVAVSTSSAFADGGNVAPPLSPVHVSLDVTDWSGGYGGLSYSMISGDASFPAFPANNGPWEDGNGFGIFAGYNWQSDTFVYGVEASYTTVDDLARIPTGNRDDFLNEFFDLRARGGYAVGQALIYGAVGYSVAGTSWDGTTAFPDDANLTGFNFGIGFDYQITDQFVVGLDYTTHDLEGRKENPGNPYDIESQFDVFSLRVAYRF